MSAPTTTAAPAAPSITHAFVLTWGVQFVAYTLDIALWGIGFVMVLQYFRLYGRKDPSLFKIVVGILGIFSTLHAIFLAIMNYKDYVELFGNFEAQNTILHEANVMLVCVFIVSFTAQMFYASRIWVLTKRDWRFVFPVVILGVIQLAGGIGQTILVAKVGFYSRLQRLTAPVSSTQAGASLLCDMLITAILFVVLRNSRTGVRRTDSALDKMMVYALNRGVMTSLWATLHLIFFVSMPGTFVFMLFIVPSVHLYVISVCSMLISRESLQHDLHGTDGVIDSFPMLTGGHAHAHEHSQFVAANPVMSMVGNGDGHAGPGIGTEVHVSTSVLKWADARSLGGQLQDKMDPDLDSEPEAAV